jgi:hypothetical protein
MGVVKKWEMRKMQLEHVIIEFHKYRGVKNTVICPRITISANCIKIIIDVSLSGIIHGGHEGSTRERT